MNSDVLLTSASRRLATATPGELAVSGEALDPKSEEIAGLALQCLAHLFTWIPLANYVSPHLLQMILHFSTVNQVRFP